MGTIVCGIDDSSGARRAASVAARLANDLDSRAVLVHVVEHDARSTHSLAPPRVTRESTIKKTLETIADGHGFPPGTQVHLEAGNPVAGLFRAASECDAELLVVAARGVGHVKAALLGSVSSALMRKSPCPVVVVPPNSIQALDAASTQPVVCGVEGSERDPRVLRLGADLANRLGGELHAVHAFEVPVAHAAAPAALSPPIDVARRNRAERTLVDALEEAGVDARMHVSPLAPHEALERVAHEQRAALIVVGLQGRAKLGSILHGSVTTRLAACGSTPAVVLPGDAQLAVGSGHYELTAGAA
ncbi:MAG: universal stress protein [Thermoleophilaceae bacterium]|nr:universal stress protein [Thermoleophilaceae bacterium]